MFYFPVEKRHKEAFLERYPHFLCEACSPHTGPGDALASSIFILSPFQPWFYFFTVLRMMFYDPFLRWIYPPTETSWDDDFTRQMMRFQLDVERYYSFEKIDLTSDLRGIFEARKYTCDGLVSRTAFFRERGDLRTQNASRSRDAYPEYGSRSRHWLSTEPWFPCSTHNTTTRAIAHATVSSNWKQGGGL